MAQNFNLAPKKKAELTKKFADLCKAPVDDQVEFFLKSFIFALGNHWKQVSRIAENFQKACRESGEENEDMNPVQAGAFLQKHGVTRTASERKAEVKDIDLNSDNRISFIEYIILHYKSMILNEFYKRMETDPIEDLSNGAVGVLGVGDKLLDELFNTDGPGMDEDLIKALEDFTAMKKEKHAKLRDLEQRSKAEGVKGKAALNELKQLEQEDKTDFNRLEITLNAAKRKALKSSGEIALRKKKKIEEDSEKQKLKASRERLAQLASAFENSS